MKILRIRFCNITSFFGEHEIDFAECAPRGGLLAICGVTGAGKSSILDAITLALFGKIARFGGTKIGAKNADAPFMSAGAGECFSECEFEAGGERFVASFSLRRARAKAGGKLQNAQRAICDGAGRVLAHKLAECDAKIEEILGLNFAAFNSSVVLPQGQFANFLHADSGAKSALLELLTSSQIYRQIGQQAHINAKALRAQTAQLQGVIEAARSDGELARAMCAQTRAQIRTRRQNALKARCDGLLALANAAAEQKTALKKYLENIKNTCVVSEAREFEEFFAYKRYEAYKIALKAFCEQSTAKCDAAIKLIKAKQIINAFVPKDFAKFANVQVATAAEFITEEDFLREFAAQKNAAQKAQSQHLAGQISEVLSAMNARFVAAEFAKISEFSPPEAAALDVAKINERLTRLNEMLDIYEAERVAEAKKSTAAKEFLAQIEPFSAQIFSAAGANFAPANEQTARQKYAQICQAASAQEAAAQAKFERAKAQTAAAKNQRAASELAAQLEPGAPCCVCGSCEHPAPARAGANEAAAQAALEAALGEFLAAKEAAAEQKSAAQKELEREEAAAAQMAAARALARDVAAVCERCGVAVAAAGEAGGAEGGAGGSERDAGGAGGAEGGALGRYFAAVSEEILRARTLAQQPERAPLPPRLEPTGGAKSADCSAAAAGGTGVAKSADGAAALATACEICARKSAEFAQLAALCAQLAARAKAAGAAQIEAAAAWLEAAAASAASAQKSVRAFADFAQRAAQILPSAQHFAHDLAAALAPQTPAPLSTPAPETAAQICHALQRLGFEQREHSRTLAAAAQRLQETASWRFEDAEAAKILRERRQKSLARSALAEFLCAQISAPLEEIFAAKNAAYERAREEFVRAEQAAKSLAAQAFAPVAPPPVAPPPSAFLSQRAGQVAELLQRRIRELFALAAAPLPAQILRASLSAQAAEKLAQNASAQAFAAAIEFGKAQEISRAAKAEIARKAAAQKQLRELADRGAARLELERYIGSANGDKFNAYAQALALQIVLEYANFYLAKIFPRYELCLEEGGAALDICVRDLHDGGSLRPAKTLSGGETFAVSLAAALGLARLASGRFCLQTMFLDEGFGSLDAASLDVAIDALVALCDEENGKLIGIISHVGEISERLGRCLRVVRTAAGAQLVGPGCSNG